MTTFLVTARVRVEAATAEGARHYIADALGVGLEGGPQEDYGVEGLEHFPTVDDVDVAEVVES